MRSRAVFLAALAVALAAPASAGAATVTNGGTTLTFIASAGEANHLTISDNIGTLTTDFNDTGAVLSSSACTLPGGAPHHVAQCSPYGINQHLVSLLDGNDYVFDANGPMLALGGDGDDSLFGSPQADQLLGGLGNDRLYGDNGDDFVTDAAGFTGTSGGNDRLRGGDGADSPGSGNDTLDGGSMVDGSGAGSDLLDGADGFDTADYSQRTATLNITVADMPGGTDQNIGNDGEAGEHDNVVNIEHLIGGSAADSLSAGGANSVLEGAAGNDTLVGGAGNDRLYGGWSGPNQVNAAASVDDTGTGDDTLDGGAGADTFHGGDGFDTVTYASRTTPVAVTMNGVADDGAPGEHDDVLSDIEAVLGGSGNDNLAGDSAANTLDGGAGNDTIDGLGGDDALTGGAGNDTITGGTGSDTIAGGDGDDMILARDGSPDTITCGPGNDTVVADAVDTVAADCEHVMLPSGSGPGLGTPTGTPATVTLPAGVTFRHGAAKVRVSCPATTPGGCAAGRLTLGETSPKRRKLASASFTLAAGDQLSVPLKLSAAKLRALRRTKHLKARLTATARDANRHPATAARAVKLKLGR